jgi:hypothetical protein
MATATRRKPSKNGKKTTTKRKGRVIPISELANEIEKSLDAQGEADDGPRFKQPPVDDADELQASDVPLDTNAPTSPPEATDDAPRPVEPVAEETPDQLLGRIEAAECECEEAGADVESAKVALKEAKEVLAAKVTALRRLARRRREREEQARWNANEAKRREEEKARNDAARPLLSESNGHADPWAGIQLDAEFDGAALKAMHAVGLATFGDYAKWAADGKTPKDLPGIGEAKAEVIRKQFDAFWQEQGMGAPVDAPEQAEPGNN